MYDRQSLPHAWTDRSPTVEQLRATIARRLGIDARALSAFRIALGLLVLADLAVVRAPQLVTFYTDQGVLPRSALSAEFPRFARWSIHAASGSARAQAALFAVAGGFAALLVVGYRTRPATAAAFLLQASLYARNPYVLNGGDTILLSFLFLGVFLPLGERWSVDAVRRGGAERRVVSVATATTLLYFVLVYATNAAFKFASDAWMSGVAVRQIFRLEHHVVRLGPTVAEYPALLVAINWLWVGLLSASVLLVATVGRSRVALVASFVAAHLGMAATMRLGLFPFVMIAGLGLFLPSRLWGRVEDIVPARALAGATDRALAAAAGVGRPARAAAATLPVSRPSVAAPPSVRRTARRTGAVVLLCFLLTMLVWQASVVGLADAPASRVDSEAAEYGWTMFAPDIPEEDSWFVAETELESGETVDTFRGGEVSWSRPSDSADRYPTVLWHRYLGEIERGSETVYEPLAAYLCDRPDRDVESVTVYFVEQPVEPDGPVGDPIVRERIEHEC